MSSVTEAKPIRDAFFIAAEALILLDEMRQIVTE